MKRKLLVSVATASLLSFAPILLSNSNNCNFSQVAYAKVSSEESQQNLTNTVSSLVNKDDLQSRENNIIQAAQTDANDIIAGKDHDNSKTQQRDLKNYQDQFGQLTKIDENAEKKVKKEKYSLTPEDYKKLKKYYKTLDGYIEALQDYVSTLESDGAVPNDPDVSSSDKEEAQKNVNKTQNKFNKAKNTWLNQYAKLSGTAD